MPAGERPAPTRSGHLTFKVYGREYGKALVLFKPTSFAPGKAAGRTDDATVTSCPATTAS